MAAETLGRLTRVLGVDHPDAAWRMKMWPVRAVELSVQAQSFVDDGISGNRHPAFVILVASLVGPHQPVAKLLQCRRFKRERNSNPNRFTRPQGL